MGIIVKEEEVPEIFLGFGDPRRAELLVGLLDGGERIRSTRGYLGFRGFFEGREVGLITHGIGGPSAAIVFEDLAKAGMKVFIRVGTAGSLRKDIRVGDIVVADSATYFRGGFYTQYFSDYLCVTAAADPFLTVAISRELRSLGIKHRVGPVISSEALYAEGENLVKLGSGVGALAVEMECSTIFTLGRALGVRSAAVLVISNSLVERGEWLGTEELREKFLKVGEASIKSALAVMGGGSSST